VAAQRLQGGVDVAGGDLPQVAACCGPALDEVPHPAEVEMDSGGRPRAGPGIAAATAAGIDPDRVRFRRTVRIARRAVGPAFPPEHSRRLLAQVSADITSSRHLNPARRHRTCPRAVKRGRRNSYRVKKPGDKNIRHDGPPPSGSPTSQNPSSQHDQNKLNGIASSWCNSSTR
jgi:hypothetical protein